MILLSRWRHERAPAGFDVSRTSCKKEETTSKEDRGIKERKKERERGDEEKQVVVKEPKME